MNPIFKSKSFWTSISGVAVAVVAYLEGSLQLTGLVSAAFGAAGLIFMRMGVEKSSPNTPQNPHPQRDEGLSDK